VCQSKLTVEIGSLRRPQESELFLLNASDNRQAVARIAKIQVSDAAKLALTNVREKPDTVSIFIEHGQRCVSYVPTPQKTPRRASERGALLPLSTRLRPPVRSIARVAGDSAGEILIAES
jgi:hypothetical protein